MQNLKLMQTVRIGKHAFPATSAPVVIIGSGCAGMAAAERLGHYGVNDVLVVTEGIDKGTSRNAGSDKQTYYKLSLCTDTPDSVRSMAKTLFSGQCVDGDNALVEAALSTGCFFRLCEMGVPFPTNRYGEYVGYKTDHDPARRGTSVGPLTSRLMAQALEKAAGKTAQICDRVRVISVLTDINGTAGILCLDLDALDDPERRLFIIRCANVVIATGGPATLYEDSCFPQSQTGAASLALSAGALGKNLTEWQFGLASVKPRWNVSGSYMQALPRFISTSKDGSDAREFLPDYILNAGDILTKVFLKGYQWPFDARKLSGGSSVIDLAVYEETKVKGRRVFLDYRVNPLAEKFDVGLLSVEARDYLRAAGALFGNPIERLNVLNKPAIEFYQKNGVDLSRDMLEISLCAQHNNGGIDVDCWWRTRVEGLYVIGEAAGTHGVYRPGGSALNAGQAGAERCAKHIAAKGRAICSITDKYTTDTISRVEDLMKICLLKASGEPNIHSRIYTARCDMSSCAGAVRDPSGISELLEKTHERLSDIESTTLTGAEDIPDAYGYRDMLLGQIAYLMAMKDYIMKGGKSRGSAVYFDNNGEKPGECFPEDCRFLYDDGSISDTTQLVRLNGDIPETFWRLVRPIPQTDDFFENVWREYRENNGVL